MRALLAAAAAYLILYGVWSWPLAVNSSTHVPFPARSETVNPKAMAMQRIRANDQLLTVAGIARNAHALAHGRVAKLIDHGLCHPTPNAAVLGEHMIEASVLALPAYAATGNPIVAYNFAALGSAMIAGLGMFALIRYWTGATGAAFVAGLLFAFHPGRLGNQTHLAVSATHWIPLVVLCFERLIQGGHARHAAMLAGTAIMASLTGAYPLIILAVFCGTFGIVRMLQLRRLLDRRRVLLLAAAVGVAGGVVLLALYPYATDLPVWSVPRRRPPMLAPYQALWPGGAHALAGTGFVLALLAVMRGGRARPRLVLAVLSGTLACMVTAAGGPLWPGGPALPSLYMRLASFVPLLGAVRAPVMVAQGVQVGLVMLAGLGIAVLTARLQRPLAAAVVVLASGAVVGETLYEPLADLIYPARSHQVALRDLRPSPEVLGAYRAFDARGLDGPILDLPYRGEGAGVLASMPNYVYLAGYHLRPTTACYNSVSPSTYAQIDRLAGRLPDDRGLQELAALGVRNLVLRRVPSARDRYTVLNDHDAVERLYDSPRAASYRIHMDPPTHSDPSRLRPIGARVPHTTSGHFFPTLTVELKNESRRTWVSPMPLEPLRVVVRLWRAGSGVPAAELERRMLLPLATAPRHTDVAVIDLRNVEASGIFEVDIEVPGLGWRLSPGGQVQAR